MSRNADIKMYQTLEEKSEWLNFKYRECRASYRGDDNAQWQALELKPSGSSTENTYLVEGGADFNPDNSEIQISQVFSLEGLDQLFSASADSLMAVALPSDIIGIAAIWWSDKSLLRGCEYNVGEISYDEAKESSKKAFTFRKAFAKGVLAGSLFVQYRLYLKEVNGKRKPGFASKQGTILGNIGVPLKIMIDGDGSAFPISIVSQEGEPLWWTEIHIDDANEDPFSQEMFNIIINDKHPAFKMLGQAEGYTKAPIFAVIIAGAIEELILYLRYELDYDFSTSNVKNLTPGTVAHAITWMVSTFDIDISTIGGLHKSVHKMVKSLLKGGDSQ